VRYVDTYFRNDELNYVPLVRTTLRNPLGYRSVEMEFVIDTGFQGGVLIPFHIYIDLRLNLFEEPKVVAQTATGNKIELRVSKVLISIGKQDILCTAYTALGVRRSLIGREVLKKTGLLYTPPNELKLGLS